MNFIDELKSISMLKKDLSELNKHVEYLKKSNLPLVLYGIAEFGHRIKHFLDENNVRIDFAAVDKEYWQPDMRFYEFDVHPLDSVLANCSKMNIVIAFFDANILERMALLDRLQNVQKCLFLDVIRPVFDSGFDFDFLSENSSVLGNLYNCLADDLSRQVMLEHMRTTNSLNAKELARLNVQGELQYFPDFLPLSENETFVDCGAFSGDTIKVFLNKTNGKFNKIFAFEPDPTNFEKLAAAVNRLWGGGGGGGGGGDYPY